MTLPRRVAAEALGSALLVAAVVGSGVMGERLSGGSAAVALLANTAATGCALVALILTFGPVSGAHFNPLVTIADASRGKLAWSAVPPYVLAQSLGAILGVALANIMFSLPIVEWSRHARGGWRMLLSEFVATFGLLAVIQGCGRERPSSLLYAVGAYISAAFWFTPSTSFANPAVTVARSLSDSFTGIRPSDVPLFVAAQALGAATATAFFGWLDRTRRSQKA
jgi:glycerol uptake facilitator-like aquaporin